MAKRVTGTGGGRRRSPGMRTDGAPRPRFEVYVIDSGWPTPAAEVVRRSMPLFAKYLRRHAVYILTPDQSTQFLRKHPQLLGKDPIIAVLDREAIRRESAGGIGARLLLGRIRDEYRALALLKMLLRIVNTRELAADLPGAIRRFVHREGVAGAVEIVMSAAGHLEAESGH
jgi:hypothetical protein